MHSRLMIRLGGFVLCAAALGLAGCGKPTPPGAAPGTTAGKGDKPADPAAETLPELKGDVSLTVATWDEVQEKIAAHKGKIVVIDIWSNWCEPCQREFPHLVKLQRRHLNDVVAMSLNTNFAGLTKEPSDEDKSGALEFLTKQGAKFENFLSSVPDEELYKKLDVASIPVVLVYGRDGKLAKSFNNDRKEFGPEFTYEKHIVPFVKQLVEEKPAAAGR